MLEQNKIYLGNCLDLMGDIQEKSISMVLCDLPYGTTACKWDSIIPFDKLWEHYERIIKDSGVIVLFGSEPFSSLLRTSNLEMFRYDWIWDKTRGTNFQHAKKMPMKSHEIISVFYKRLPTYNPQMREGTPYKTTEGFRKNKTAVIMDLTDKQKQDIEDIGRTYNAGVYRHATVNEGTRYPLTILTYKKDSKLHPCSKPVQLLEYLIKTYTNEGELVLDNCMGSGSTIVACKNTNRNYIGIEKDEQIYSIAYNRINGFIH